MIYICMLSTNLIFLFLRFYYSPYFRFKGQTQYSTTLHSGQAVKQNPATNPNFLSITLLPLGSIQSNPVPTTTSYIQGTYKNLYSTTLYSGHAFS